MERSRISGRLGVAIVLGLILVAVVALPALGAPPVKGAIFTTNWECQQVNGNIYDTVFDVYLNGGPAKLGAAGLPNGDYYVKVTQPNGRLLGTSIGSGNDKPVHVSGGEFATCMNLWDMLVTASDGTVGYDLTGNPGGEYKVWVSNEATFKNNSTKTDNFKIRPGEVIGPQ